MGRTNRFAVLLAGTLLCSSGFAAQPSTPLQQQARKAIMLSTPDGLYIDQAAFENARKSMSPAAGKQLQEQVDKAKATFKEQHGGQEWTPEAGKAALQKLAASRQEKGARAAPSAAQEEAVIDGSKI